MEIIYKREEIEKAIDFAQISSKIIISMVSMQVAQLSGQDDSTEMLRKNIDSLVNKGIDVFVNDFRNNLELIEKSRKNNKE